MRTMIFAGAAVVAVVLGVMFYPGAGASMSRVGPGMLAGAPAASFPLTRLDGKADSLDAYRGRVVLVNLWASWCTACRDEEADLERFARANAHDVVVLGIDEGESSSAAAAFRRQYHLSYPVLLDEQQLYGRAYAAVGLPTTVIVGRDGKIVRGIDGTMTLADMRDAVAPALAAR